MDRSLSRASTNPTPMIVTLCAFHVHTSIIFLNRDLAFWAPMSTYFICPSTINFFFCLLACLYLVHGKYTTLKTKISLASMTLNFHLLRLGYLYHNIFTLGIRTKFLEFVLHDLSVLKKHFILFKILFRQQFLQLIFRNRPSASTFWTSE